MFYYGAQGELSRTPDRMWCKGAECGVVKVRILQYSTFRLNLSCTSPYNADFDGDEMNMHVPQSHLTRAEVKEIMLSPKQIVVPANNKPVMGIVQDTLMGSRKFTLRGCFVEKDLLMHMLMWLPGWDGNLPKPAILKPKVMWTGKQIFSLLIPNEINIVRTSNDHDDAEDKTSDKFNSPLDTRVVIDQGELLSGIIDKKTIGSAGGGIVHVLWKDFGPDAAKKFLNDTQLVMNQWILQTSFTVGVADMIPNAKTNERINTAIQDAKDKVKTHVQKAQSGDMPREPGLSLLATFEAYVNKDLNAAVQASGKLAKNSLHKNNNVLAMVNSGSKGSHINISQMSACVGQQNVEGKRMPYGFKDRTLPHFAKNDFGPESRGFVENSYLKGLTPQEVFFHAMGGREGLVDTAVKTAETGYIQRRLVKAMEDVTACYDGTVRNSLGEVVQFVYGEDGLDASHCEGQKVNLIKNRTNSLRRNIDSRLSS